MPSSHLILCRPLLLLTPIPPRIRVFSNELTLCMRWPKYWSFTFSISPSSEHPGLIFRIDWLDLLAVQGTLKSLLQHHSSKASIFQRSAFFHHSPTLTSRSHIHLYKKQKQGVVKDAVVGVCFSYPPESIPLWESVYEKCWKSVNTLDCFSWGRTMLSSFLGNFIIGKTEIESDKCEEGTPPILLLLDGNLKKTTKRV